MNITINNSQKTQHKQYLIPILKDQYLEAKFYDIRNDFDVSESFLEQNFKAEKGELFSIYNGKQQLFLLGLGEAPLASNSVDIFKNFSFKNKKFIQSNLVLDLNYIDEDEFILKLVEAAINGLYLGTYDIGFYQTKTKNKHQLIEGNLDILYQKLGKDKLQEIARRGYETALTQMEIMNLVNFPSNKKSPEVLANWAIQSGKKNGFAVNVLDKEDIEKLGLHGLLAVNRGSEFPPRFIIMEYNGAAAKKYKTIGLVGKGVTFDTGGISIKPSTNMHYMKSDMGGAAAVLGTLELVAKLKLPIRLVGIVPTTPNCVDALSIKPSDVIGSYSGKTIEIIDTDAEGRLILADGLAYITKHFNPDILIDLATLTGSVVRTFGYHCAGLFSKNETLLETLTAAANQTGERVWTLPLWDDYNENLASDVADIKNYSGKPLSAGIDAAKFLEFFTDNHPAWAHLDIAGVAFGNSGLSKEKSATAYGIRLLTTFIELVSSEAELN